MTTPKLFLYSMHLENKHFSLLEELTGKKAENIHFACIENATDIIPGAEDWVPGIRQSLANRGYDIEVIDLRKYTDNNKGLAEKFSNKDLIWVCGGHTYYLRWILQASGADELICKHVAAGKVYAGWSAGAIMAGPSTKHFHLMGDDPKESPEIIYQGLELTDTVIIPHIDSPDFAEGAAKANAALIKEGFKTQLLKDDQALVVNGDSVKLV